MSSESITELLIQLQIIFSFDTDDGTPKAEATNGIALSEEGQIYKSETNTEVVTNATKYPDYEISLQIIIFF